MYSKFHHHHSNLAVPNMAFLKKANKHCMVENAYHFFRNLLVREARQVENISWFTTWCLYKCCKSSEGSIRDQCNDTFKNNTALWNTLDRSSPICLKSPLMALSYILAQLKSSPLSCSCWSSVSAPEWIMGGVWVSQSQEQDHHRGNLWQPFHC